jgi:hypothetical protein
MTMTTFPQAIARTPHQFLFLAETRRREALALLKEKQWLGAFYLAGYAFECALKAVIAKQNRGNLPDALFTHDISILRPLVLAHVSERDVETLQAVPNWSHLLRYDCKAPEPGAVVKFIDRVMEARRCLSTYV